MIKYKAGYKYQLVESYSFMLHLAFEPVDHLGSYIGVSARYVTVKAGYAWDGPSGPTVDSKCFMRGSLEHDVAYQLMREGVLPKELRMYADKKLISTCKEDGMAWIRRQWVYAGVKYGASKAARASSLKKIHMAGK